MQHDSRPGSRSGRDPRAVSALLLAVGLLLGLLPAHAARASHSGGDPLLRVSGGEDCDPALVPRSAPDLNARPAIVIVGDEGPTGFISGHDPVTGEPIPRSGAGVSGGTGTEDDPYIIEGWLIEQAGNGISLQDTTAHVIIRENRLAHNASHAVRLENVANVALSRNIIETNVGSGVHVEGPAADVVVTDNALYDNQRGLSASDTDGLVATRNAVLESRGAGIELAGSADARVEGNVVDLPAGDGINVDASPGAALTCNRVTNGAAIGIFLGGGSTGASIEANRVDDHGYGILVSASHETLVHANHVTWSTGFGESTSIFVYESNDVSVTSNDVSVARFGIVVRRSSENLVEDNRITEHTWGVFCTGNAAGGNSDSPQGALRNHMLGNTIVGHERSVVLRECDETLVAGNRMTDQAVDGIHDFEGVENVHSENTIDGAPRAAIYLWRDGGHQVAGNRITRSEDGVRVLDSSGNRIVSNELEDNRYGVIIRQGSSGNVVEGNHLIGSTGVGVYLAQGADASVRRNNVIHNDVGVAVGSEHRRAVVHDNDIRGNTRAGLIVQRDEPVDATGNWWGCAEGPGDPECDGVQGAAEIEPWRTAPVPGLARSPVIEPLDEQVVPIGSELALTVEAHHPDRDPFALTARDLPDGASFDPETGLLHWRPASEQVGTHLPTFTADDGAQRDEQTLTIFVPPEVPGPVASDDTARVERGQEVAIDVLANDEFREAAADWASVRPLSQPRGRHEALIERSDSGYPTLRFSAGGSANDARFDYEVCDVEGRCDSATVIVVVD